MSQAKTPELTVEIRRQLNMANAELAMYARDLKLIVDKEREKAQELTLSHQQLQAYARDLKTAFDAEKRKSQELAEANARLQILDRLKADFLTFISHELRTALTAMSVIHTFDSPNDAQLQAQMIELNQQGYDRLHAIINKGLEYFKWLALRSDAVETADLATVVRQVVSRSPGLQEPGVDFHLSCPATPCLVRGEESHLAEVVQTLVDNAVKFSGQEKFIRIDLQAGEDKVTLSVVDHGLGFAPELAQEIFRPFTIADVMHYSQGTGLSLTLASAMVEAYGSRMRAKSEGEGKGATFTVEFPALPLPRQVTGEQTLPATVDNS